MNKQDALNTIKDYQRVIKLLDEKLSLYESLGTPKEIADILEKKLKRDSLNESLKEPVLVKEIIKSPSKQVLVESKDILSEKERNKSFTRTRVSRLLNEL